jgi:hypothetical protein
MPASGRVELLCHSAVPAPDPLQVHVSFARSPGNVLSLSYSIDAALDQIRIPEPGAAGRTDELWKHTCFEAFLGFDGAAAYHEFNFAPSGAWAFYRFSAYRAGMAAVTPARAPQVAVRREAQRVQLDAAVALADLGGAAAAVRLRLGLAAVVEGADGTLSYWALRHATAKPDFHHRENFAITIP